MVPFALTHRPDDAGVSLRLVPISSPSTSSPGRQPDAKCRYGDTVSRAMYAGDAWQLNEHALTAPRPQGQPNDWGGSAMGPPDSVLQQKALDGQQGGAGAELREGGEKCTYPPAAWTLYMMSASGNGYQVLLGLPRSCCLGD